MPRRVADSPPPGGSGAIRVKLRRAAHRVAVPGFRFAGVRAGLKTAGPDVALIVPDAPAVVAGMFTTNRAPAAPVVVSRRRIRAGLASAVLVHAGNANACTGREGLETVEVSTALAARLLGVPAARVLACATGRIGVQVPRATLLRGVRAAAAALSPRGFADAARAICTTDAFPKTAVRRVRAGGRTVTVAAMGKGAGMIAPDMATLLVVVVTDARVARPALARALAAGVEETFNAISVDGDMSTNDTVLALAGGAAGNRPIVAGSADYRRFAGAVAAVLDEVARLVVLDGEGASKLVTVTVRGARSAAEARRVARAVGESVLCKAAFAGGDPNWGRFVCAAGTAGVPLDADRVDVAIGGVAVARRGRPVPGALGPARRAMRGRELEVVLDLHAGGATGRLRTSDLTVAYVHFNAAYTT
ncbi:MAG TPA: bifunctional glutamate N-acetyltransferase/amino-acid acetyltransferase ArgJ [Candidatus Binatia bacterium]|nr:bifunctional glutamate N-acetyltransferase/amino-acid acetyltransferase ArgJ [Candidatus Binatia bacterium]